MELCYRNNPKSLFRKYNQLITSLTAHQLFRDYLSYNNLPLSHRVDLLLPNGHHTVVERYRNGRPRTVQAIFTTKAVYAPKLYAALYALDITQQWIGNFEEAQKLLLWELGLINNPHLLPLRILLSSFSFNPNANVETTSVDGTIQSQATTWALVRSGTGLTATDSVVSDLIIHGEQVSAADFRGNRSFFLFDTASLPDSDAISSALLYLYKTDPTGEGDVTNPPNFTIVSSTPAANTAIVTGDWANVGSTRFNSSDYLWSVFRISANGYINMPLNASGIAAISKTGVTKLAIRTSNDLDNLTPGAEARNYGSGFYADNGSNKPILEVTYNPSVSVIYGGSVPNTFISYKNEVVGY